jgi:hypothetical protein
LVVQQWLWFTHSRRRQLLAVQHHNRQLMVAGTLAADSSGVDIFLFLSCIRFTANMQLESYLAKGSSVAHCTVMLHGYPTAAGAVAHNVAAALSKACCCCCHMLLQVG